MKVLDLNVENETRWYHDCVPRSSVERSGRYLVLEKGGGFFMDLKDKKVYILKIGTSVLLNDHHKPDLDMIEHIVQQVVTLQAKGYGIILVISGAIAFGSYVMGLDVVDRDTREAVAGVGQAHLISTFRDSFSKKNIQVAQMLFTREDLSSPVKRNDISHMLQYYLDTNIIPVLNENDVIELASFGGNDLLAAEIAMLFHVHHLIILSTMKGSKFGVGGEITKLEALEIVKKKNIKADIVNGKEKNILLKTII